MARYIDADKLNKGIRVYDGKCSVSAVFHNIDNAPTADVEEVRHGVWIYGEDEIAHCSECGNEIPEHSVTRYCDYCGAKMDGEVEAEE